MKSKVRGSARLKTYEVCYLDGRNNISILPRGKEMVVSVTMHVIDSSLGSPVRARNVLIADRSSVVIFSSRGRRKASASSIKSTTPDFDLSAQSNTEKIFYDSL